MPRTPLLHPDAFFEERPHLDVGTALVLGLLLALVTTAGVGVFGLVFTDALDATVAVDNPAHAPDWVCDMNTDSGVSTPSGCAEDIPETVDRELGALVWEEFVNLLPFVFVGALVAGLLTAVGLHLLSGLGDAQGSFGDTLAVTAWGATPLVVQTVGGVGYLSYRIRGLDLPSQPEAAIDQLATLSTFESQLPLLVLSLVVTAWQAYIWTYGLAHVRDVRFDTAALAAGVVGAGLFLFTLLG